MDWPQLVLFVCAAALVEISPGPNFLLITKTVPSAGKCAGYANIVGFSLAFCVHGALSIGGVSIIVAQSAMLFTIVKWLGALYLCWLGIKALLEARNGSLPIVPVAQQRQQTIVTGFKEGLLTNLLNPKISMFYLAMFPQFVSAGSGTATASALLVALHVVINVGWFTFVVQFIDRIARATKGERAVRWFKAISGVALIGLGASFMTVSMQ